MKLLTFDEVGDALDDIAEQFPQILFQGLNGGVNLLEDTKRDEEIPDSELYIMGEYCHDSLGKYINLYYGSFAALAKKENWRPEDWLDELWTTLSHELTHHMEGLGGLHALDDRDEEEMAEFRREYEARQKKSPAPPKGGRDASNPHS
ncbi:metallopeptidase family protein [Oscillibacter sp.]|uniref:metallopeptidase family protein n=1 Tax=Oscillibacter sp. TaxID=1945593 RepID=UPI0028A1412B|nr:metallopeptidase family protein [Oscillibacter sp.]